MVAKFRITSRRIAPDEVLESVRDRHAGGIVMFLGTVREQSEGRKVVGLAYETYKEMAEKKMAVIADEMVKRWPVRRVSMVHRVGRLKVGEVSVAVAVSCEHRAEAFEACRYGIDAIKSLLPLWKKDLLQGGSEEWVKGTPIERS